MFPSPFSPYTPPLPYRLQSSSEDNFLIFVRIKIFSLPVPSYPRSRRALVLPSSHVGPNTALFGESSSSSCFSCLRSPSCFQIDLQRCIRGCVLSCVGLLSLLWVRVADSFSFLLSCLPLEKMVSFSDIFSGICRFIRRG